MPSAVQPRVLFLAQCFESKAYADSAGYSEIVAPMTASGLLGTTAVHSWGRDLAYFHRYIASEIAALAATLGDAPVVVYGAGAHSEEFWGELSQLNVVAFSDSDPLQWGRVLLGKKVIEPTRIPELAGHVVVSSRAWDREICRQLRESQPGICIHPLYEHLLEATADDLHAQVAAVVERHPADAFDLIVYCPANPAEAFAAEDYRRLREHFSAKLATVWWDYDDSGPDNDYMRFERCSLEWSDLIVDPGNYSKTARLQRRATPYHLHPDVEKVRVLPTAFDPATFQPGRKDWNAPVAIFGSLVGERRRWKEFLEKRYPERFRHLGGVYQGRTPLPMADYARLCAVTPIVVNTQTYSFRSQCKGKVREALACAALLLEEDNPESRSYFGDFDGVGYFADEDGLATLVDHYLARPEEAEERGRAAHQWYLENWSATPWTRKILEAL